MFRTVTCFSCGRFVRDVSSGFELHTSVKCHILSASDQLTQPGAAGDVMFDAVIVFHLLSFPCRLSFTGGQRCCPQFHQEERRVSSFVSRCREQTQRTHAPTQSRVRKGG